MHFQQLITEQPRERKVWDHTLSATASWAPYIMKSFFQDSSQPSILRWLYLFSWLIAKYWSNPASSLSIYTIPSMAAFSPTFFPTLSPSLALAPALQLSEHTDWAVFLHCPPRFSKYLINMAKRAVKFLPRPFLSHPCLHLDFHIPSFFYD